MKKINVNLFPKSGYIFIDKDGTRHVSTRSWKDVINRLHSYRRVNKMPLGDPEREVMDQACERNPGYCYEDTAAPTTFQGKSTLKTQVLKWLAEIRRALEKITFVSSEKSSGRANVCATCPFNVVLKQGCAPCMTFIAEMRKSILKNRNVDSRLNACDKFSRDAAVMVHLDEVTVVRDDLPDHCWMKAKK